MNKEEEEIQNKILTEVQKARNTLITKAGATPMKDDILGDKAIQNILGELKKITPTNLKGEYLGLDTLMTDAKDKTKKIPSGDIKTSLQIMSIFYKSLGDKKIQDMFTEVPGQSVQAMCIAVNSFIKNCVCGNDNYSDEIDLMTRCAIESNGVLSYNLPIVKKNGKLNMFSQTITDIKDGKFTKSDPKIKLSDDFKKNASLMLKKIVSEAEKMKKEYDKTMEKYYPKQKESE